MKNILRSFAVLSLFFSASPASADLPFTPPTRDVWVGKHKVLIVLLEWDNKPANVSHEEVERTFFGTGPDDYSMQQFFQENAAGRFEISGKVLPWKHTEKKWTRFWCMTQEKLANMFDHLSGCSPRTIARQAWEMVKDSVNIADYDLDGDGKIDHFYVVHSGRMWKQRGTPDDVFYYNASFAQETAVFQSQGIGKTGLEIPIGFFIHESGHGHFLLGDYYGSSPGYEKGNYGLGMWGIMGLGAWGMSNFMPASELFRYPAHFEAASKVRIGWAKTQVYTKSFRHVRLRPVEQSGDVAVVPMGDTQQKAFFFEYRSNQGFSRKHPGHGLLIWKGWDLMQADGRDDLNHGNILNRRPLPPNNENFGDASDPFPGSLGITSYRDAATGLQIENIVQTGEFVEFDIVFPNEELEKASERAFLPALRTVSVSFRPETLNGLPFNGPFPQANLAACNVAEPLGDLF